MQRTPPKSETLIPASAFTQTTILVETARARVAVGRINDRVVVLKRFRAATANPDRWAADALPGQLALDATGGQPRLVLRA